MKALQLSGQHARELYKTADKLWLKQMLEDSFTPEELTGSMKDFIKVWEDACTITGDDPVKSLPFPDPQNRRQIAANAFYKMDVIRELLNSDVPQDGAWLYYPFFDRSGGGFSYYGCDYSCTYSSVGARLSYHSSELAIYAGKQFLDIYRDFMTL